MVSRRYLCRASSRSLLKNDRLGRSVKDVLTIADDLHERGIGLRILTGKLAGNYTPTGEGKFFFTMMAAFAVISSPPVDHGCDLGGRVEDGVFDLAA